MLGPKIWNLAYDRVLRLPLEGKAWLFGFADDLGMVVAADTSEELTPYVNFNLRKIETWLRDHDLRLARQKTEAVILRGTKTQWHDVRFRIGDVEVTPSKSIKYLGVLFGRGTHFGSQWVPLQRIRESCSKADSKAQAVARLMPNIDGPSSVKRSVLASAHTSVLLYVAPIWADFMKYGCYKQMVNRSQRKILLRVASAYRTVSVQALQVITGTHAFTSVGKERGL